jgi:O-antigen ligase
MKLLLRYYDQIKIGAISVLIVTLPFHYFISSIIILLVSALTLFKIAIAREREPFRLDAISLSFILFYVLEVFSLIYTDPENLKVGLNTMEKHMALVLLPIIFSDIKMGDQRREMFFNLFVIGCLVGSLICIGVNMQRSWQAEEILFHPWLFSHERLSDPIGIQAVYFALYLGFAILVLQRQLLLNQAWSFIRILKLLILTYFALFLILLGARTAIASVLIIVLLNLVDFILEKKSYRTFLITLIVPVVCVWLISLNPIVTTRFVDMLKDDYNGSNYGSYFARTKIWEPGIDVIKKNIWLGVGNGDEQKELDKKYKERGYLEAIDFLNMHNEYLQVLLGLGIVGLALFLWSLFLQVRNGLRKMDMLYLSFMGLFMLTCLTESLLNRNKGIIFFLTFSLMFCKPQPLSHSKTK